MFRHMIEIIKQCLIDNPYLGIISLFITLISIISGIYFYFKSKKIKDPRYAFKSVNLVRDFVSKLEALEMRYAGEEIKNLTATKLILWNNGNDTIRKSDIASKDSIIVEIKDNEKFLDVRIIYQKKAANEFSLILSENRKHMKIDFEYIDKNEGAIIQMLHTGRSSKDLRLCGTIIGANAMMQVRPFASSIVNILDTLFIFDKSKIPLKIRKIITSTAFFLLPLILIVSNAFSRQKIINSILGYTVVGFITFLYWFSALLIMKRDFPKGFEQFEEPI